MIFALIIAHKIIEFTKICILFWILHPFSEKAVIHALNLNGLRYRFKKLITSHYATCIFKFNKSLTNLLPLSRHAITIKNVNTTFIYKINISHTYKKWYISKMQILTFLQLIFNLFTCLFCIILALSI